MKSRIPVIALASTIIFASSCATTQRKGAARSPKPPVEFVWIPTGSFMMGSGGYAREMPVHRVTISQPFYIGKYEVTQAQWQSVMGNNPSGFKGDNLPVEQVSWNDAQEFIQRLNQINDGYTYRLPTEAEWEYACRAGTTDNYAGNLDSMAWYGNNSGQHFLDAAAIERDNMVTYNERLTDNGNQTHPVGTKRPNAFGLYDMHGNVNEWCQDWYYANYYSSSQGTDPQGPTNGQDRVLRGGSWAGIAAWLRSASRSSFTPVSRSPLTGFRVVAVR